MCRNELVTWNCALSIRNRTIASLIRTHKTGFILTKINTRVSRFVSVRVKKHGQYRYVIDDHRRLSDVREPALVTGTRGTSRVLRTGRVRGTGCFPYGRRLRGLFIYFYPVRRYGAAKNTRAKTMATHGKCSFSIRRTNRRRREGAAGQRACRVCGWRFPVCRSRRGSSTSCPSL